jgi:hypothetical protein
MGNNPLADSSWKLKSLGNSGNMEQALSSITINFDKNGRYRGNITYYGGSYEIKGNAISIASPTFVPIEFPDNPPGFRIQCITYFALLNQAKEFSIENEELTIQCGENSLLIFTKQ